jgi:hypothetical protein
LVAATSLSSSLVVATFVVPARGGPHAVNLNAAQTLAFAVPFIVVGLVIAARRPEHPIGWGFVGSGIFFAVQAAAIAYADAALRPGGADLPAATYAGNLTQWIFAPAVLLGYTLPFLWFPDGRALSPGWRRVAQLSVAMTFVSCVGNIFAAGPLNNYPHVDNPLAVDSSAVTSVGLLAVLVYIGCILAAAVAVVIRYRRSVGIERLQMRWFLVGVVLTGFAFAVQLALLVATGDVGWGVELLFALPVCAGIAILRYRLFDIDRVISRTVTYAGLTALVVAPYLVLAALASRLARGSAFAVAALTLASLAVLRPVHRRLQATVDRRFNRARYDATRTVEAFAAGLRDEVDADAVRADLLAVTARAVEPVSLSLWVAP